MINKCCCCFPLRIGVFIIALLSFLASIAALVCLIINRSNIAGYDEYTTVVNMDAVFYTAIAISALNIAAGLFGLVGTIAQKRGMVAIFNFVNWIMTILTFIVTVGVWIFFMVRRSDIEAGCSEAMRELESEGYTVDGDLASVCSRSMQGLLIGGGIAVILGNMLSIYFACVVSAYASRLKRSNQHLPLRDLEDFPQPAYKTAY